MSIRKLERNLAIQAAKGRFPEELIPKAVLSAIMTAGHKAFAHGYYGTDAVDQGFENARAATHRGEESLSNYQDELILGYENIKRFNDSIMASTDFPLAFKSASRSVLRKEVSAGFANYQKFLTMRKATDFKPMTGARIDQSGRLDIQPELATLKYESIGSGGDSYSVAKYAKGVAVSYEMYKNDDIGQFQAKVESLGAAGLRTRNYVFVEAIRAAALSVPSRRQILGTPPTVGAPDSDRIVSAFLSLSNQNLALSDGTTGRYNPRLTDLIVPLRWQMAASNALQSQQIVLSGGAAATSRPANNQAYGLATLTVDPYLAGSLIPAGSTADDWFAISNDAPWAEMAVMEGFQDGARSFSKLPDVVEPLNFGSFSNSALEFQVRDEFGVFITNPNALIIVAGA